MHGRQELQDQLAASSGAEAVVRRDGFGVWEFGFEVTAEVSGPDGTDSAKGSKRRLRFQMFMSDLDWSIQGATI